METKPIDQKEILLLAAGNLDGILYAVDRNLVFTLSKGRKLSLLGFDSGRVIGTSMYDYLKTDDPSHPQISLHLRALKGETVVIDTSHQSVDLRTTISPLTSTDGTIVGALGLVLDITEQKRREDALQESERSYRQLFSHIPTGLYEVDFINGCFTKVNSTICTYTGYSEEELLTMSPFNILTKESQSLFQNRLEQIFRGETVSTNPEYRILNKDGSTRWVQLNSEFIKADGLITGARVVVHDISERKRTEDALREKEIKMSSLLDNMTDVVWSLTLPEMAIQYVSPSAEKVYGYPEKAFYDDPNLWKKISHPDDQHLIEKAMSELFEKGTATRECRIIRPDGSVAWILDRSKLIRDENGLPIKVEGQTQDITKRKQMEQFIQEQLQEKEALETLTKASQLHILQRFGEVDFQRLADSLLDLSGARYAAINTFENSKTVTRAIAGIPENINKAGSMLGFEIAGKAWDERPERVKYLKDGKLKRFKNLYDASFGDISKNMSALLHKLFGLGEIFVTSIKYQEKSIGDLIMFMLRDQEIQHPMIIDIFAQQVGIMLMRMRAEQSVQRQLNEKEILLKEIHHRIKNNITSIAGLLSIQSRSIKNPEALSILTQAIGRVKSMATLYEKMLLLDEYRRVQAAAYLGDLADSIIALFPGKPTVTLEKRLDDFYIDSKMAFSLGIIVNELLTNVMKYAFIDRDAGRVSLIARQKNRQMTLIVRDNGNGLPQEFDSESNHGFGIVLVKMLSQQLDGHFTIKSDSGTVCTLELPL